MEAVVLAGGFGTRLKHVVSDVPKPMAPVCGKPFLKYILDDLIEKGVRRIVLAVGYKAEVIENHFGRRYRGAELVYSMEDTPLFTGGAIKKALENCTQERVVIVNGDTYFDVDLAGMMAYAEGKDAPIVVAARHMYSFDRYGVILSEQGRIRAFLEKAPREEGDINGTAFNVGVAGFYRQLYEKITKGTPMEVTAEMAAEIIGVIENVHAANRLPVKFL